MSDDPISKSQQDDIPPAAWVVVANVVKERPSGPGGKELKRGTKHFSPGTKVYILDWHPGTRTRAIVVGRARKSGRLIKVTVSVDAVENLRVKGLYKPHIVKMISDRFENDLSRMSKDRAEELCSGLPTWQKRFRDGQGTRKPQEDTKSNKRTTFGMLYQRFLAWVMR